MADVARHTATRWLAIAASALLFILALTGCGSSSTAACPTGPGIATFHVPSQAMEPTIPANSDILVNTRYYKTHPVASGDIIVFRPPPLAFPSSLGIPDLIKRVIGLPGETISSANGNVLINGSVLVEPWLPRDVPLGPPIMETTIPAGDYYVLGDNRTGSDDSRYFGPISGKLIVGKVETNHWKVCS